MGIDQQTAGILQQGVDLAGDIMGLANRPMDGSSAMAWEADARARLAETDAKGDALDVQRKTKKEARAIRAEGERMRSKRNASWGGSNLAMSGSRKLVADGSRIKDRQAEDDMLFEGQMDANRILNEGRHRGNLFRINGEGAPERSTLSLGSKIYSRR